MTETIEWHPFPAELPVADLPSFETQEYLVTYLEPWIPREGASFVKIGIWKWKFREQAWDLRWHMKTDVVTAWAKKPIGLSVYDAEAWLKWGREQQ